MPAAGLPPEGEAGRILESARRDGETLGGSSLARMSRRLGDHFAGVEPGNEDKPDGPEIWGRRVGRALSVILSLALAWWLGTQLAWW